MTEEETLQMLYDYFGFPWLLEKLKAIRAESAAAQPAADDPMAEARDVDAWLDRQNEQAAQRAYDPPERRRGYGQ